MPKKPPNQRLVECCKGCRKANVEAKMCNVFIDPAYQWRKGKCWGAAGPEVIYLGGSINGHDTYESANEWREAATKTLEAAGYIVLNPLRERMFGDLNSKDIVERDLADIQKADILLVEMSNACMPYIGTSMEIRYAWERKKAIILWGGANEKSHWLIYHATKRFDTLNKAMKALINAKK